MKKDTTSHDTSTKVGIEAGALSITPEELAALGGGKLAYLKPILSDDLSNLFPGAPQIAPGLHLFALLAADGSPILITDSRDQALANAWEHELETVSLH
jgi:hypothetical protein